MVKKIINAILIAVGSVSLAIGVVGIFLPILPTTPFLLLTLVCYAKGSKRFERWFLSTKLYRKYLEAFLKTHAMTNGSKVRVLLLITALISIPIILVDVLPMRIVLGAVILFHWVYFIFFVKSVSKERLAELLAAVREKEAQKLKDAERAEAVSVPNSDNADADTATEIVTEESVTGENKID
ncbi:MAG: YbaN family protein [Clostridiales bacterium]|jgi:uncharacterized membrane protein YbaN (DUF454 family)|nr:YbaN family protein [Clostridiales bacterium]